MKQNILSNNQTDENCENNTNTIRVRFAPSPTGLLHVGSFRTALFNWLFARKNNGTFILRIEDTDRKRSKDEFLHSQMADMKWMGLNWDEGPGVEGVHSPYFQTQRLKTYTDHALNLVNNSKAFYCFCKSDDNDKASDNDSENEKTGKQTCSCKTLTKEKVEELRNQGNQACIRFASPSEGETIVKDLIKGDVPFDNTLIEDFVILKSDGIPTYNFAVIVDDHLMEITHVIRGDEHLSNTPRQVMLYNAFGYEPPVFAHIPIILNEDRTKLSKRHGAVHLLDFKDRGYLRESLLNFMALLGWAPKDNREIMTMEELIEAFSIDGVPKHPAVFDEKKLLWMNSQYIMTLPPETIAERLLPFIEKQGFDPASKDAQWYITAVTLYRERAKTLVELAENLVCFFTEDVEYEPAGVKKHFKPEILTQAMPELIRRTTQTNLYTVENLEVIVRQYAEELGISAAKLIHPIRLAITGKTASPPVFDVMVLAGRELTEKRLNAAARYIAESVMATTKEN